MPLTAHQFGCIEFRLFVLILSNVPVLENDNKYSIFKNRHRDVVRFSNLASSNVVGIGIGLTETPNSGWAKAHPAHLLTASLRNVQINELPMTLLMIAFLFSLTSKSEILFFDQGVFTKKADYFATNQRSCA